MPPNNRLAPPLRNSLASYVPAPLDPNMMPPEVSPRFGVGDYAQNLSIGVGEGLTSRLKSAKQTLQDPVQAVKETAMAIRQMYDDPMLALQALRQLRQQIMSGPIGAGQAIGEMAPISVRGAPSVARMAGPEDFMQRRERQLIAEEDSEAKSLIREMDERRYQEDLKGIMEHKDWLSQTERRADVVSKLQNLGLPWLGSNPDRSIFQFNQISQQVKGFDDPRNAFNARSNIASSKAGIDKDFDDYLERVREYRKTLNPRSKYDRNKMKLIDEITGDTRVTQLKPK